MELKEYFKQRYQGSESFLENVVFPIFGEEKFDDGYNEPLLENNPELETIARATGVAAIERVGTIDIPVNPIDIFDIRVASHVRLTRNRVGVQQLVRRIMSTYSSAFMIFHYDDDVVWDWRFSFCSKRTNNDTTDSKRYTFMLGPGQSCRTAAENFQKLYDKHGQIEAKDIEAAFDVEALSKEFFDKYKLHYERFVEYITGKRFVKEGSKWQEKTIHEPHAQMYADFGSDDKRVRDYVKKLLGRIVFLHFLQKKRWLGVPVGMEWGEGDPQFMKHLFDHSSPQQRADWLDSVLEPLFAEGIDTEREGGLYDTHVSLPKGSVVRIPYLNGGLFERDAMDEITTRFPEEFFADLLDFFYQYNFTIDENDPNDAQVGVDPEMLGRIFENLLEDNKDKGAFYTPKEIVQYMCRQSLAAYLQTGITDETERNAIAAFVETYNVDVLPQRLVGDIDLRLKEVKICDPAIGSGAFPMGLLKELFLCRGAIENFDNATDIKRHIIQNNIYGVDIERGAVDIARLRFWLSLVVDEQTPEALPNLDYKIMQGNSLLEQYQGLDLSAVADSKYTSSDSVSLFENMVDVYRRELRHKLFTYYSCNDHDERKKLRQEIADNVKQQLIEQGCRVDFGELDIAANSEFFLWHTWFYDVFLDGGFDIVIGNPPYFVYEGQNTAELNTLRSLPIYKIALGGKLNAYKLFWAKAIQDLANKQGTVCFIFQNSFLTDVQAANLRKYTLQNTQIIRIDSFPERDCKKKRVFESAKMSVCIPLVQMNQRELPFVVNVWNDKDKTSGLHALFTREEIEAIDSSGYSIPRLKEECKSLVIKMLHNRSYSTKCFEGELNVTSHRKFFSNDSHLPVIMKGAGIQRYYYTFDMSQGSIEYLKESEYLAACGNSEKARHHEKERIVMQGMTGANDAIRLIMALVPQGMYLGHSCKYILPTEELAAKVLLGFFNSKAANFFFRSFSTNSNVNGYEIEFIPIPAFSDSSKERMKSLVEIIISKKHSNPSADTMFEEQQIDHLVYHLYGLTYNEVRVIDPDTPITREEYDNYKTEETSCHD